MPWALYDRCADTRPSGDQKISTGRGGGGEEIVNPVPRASPPDNYFRDLSRLSVFILRLVINTSSVLIVLRNLRAPILGFPPSVREKLFVLRLKPPSCGAFMAFFYGVDGPSRFNKQNGKLSFTERPTETQLPLPKIRGAYVFNQLIITYVGHITSLIVSHEAPLATRCSLAPFLSPFCFLSHDVLHFPLCSVFVVTKLQLRLDSFFQVPREETTEISLK